MTLPHVSRCSSHEVAKASASHSARALEHGLTSAGREVVYRQRIQSVAPMMVMSQPMLCRC